MITCPSLEIKINTTKDKETISLDRNYQAVYRDILTVARDCLAGPINFTVSNKVVGQLYNDLEFGEISYYQDNLRPIYTAYVKVSRSEAKASVAIYTGSQPSWANQRLLKKIKGWANGGTSCG